MEGRELAVVSERWVFRVPLARTDHRVLLAHLDLSVRLVCPVHPEYLEKLEVRVHREIPVASDVQDRPENKEHLGKTDSPARLAKLERKVKLVSWDAQDQMENAVPRVLPVHPDLQVVVDRSE